MFETIQLYILAELNLVEPIWSSHQHRKASTKLFDVNKIKSKTFETKAVTGFSFSPVKSNLRLRGGNNCI